MTLPIRFAVLGALAVICSSAMPQPATEAQKSGVRSSANYGTMHLEAPLGSFKIIDGEGRVEMTFSGSMMLSQVDGNVAVEGQLSQIYNDRGRKVLYGKGKVVVTGKWRAIQWFGKGMVSTWYGSGIVRLTGEYDRNFNPGKFWYEDANNKSDWPVTASFDYPNPPREDVTPRRRPG